MKRGNFRLTDEIFAKVEKEAKDKKIKIAELFRTIVDEYYTEQPEFKEHDFLDDVCIVRAKLRKGYYCVVNAPRQNILGSGSLEDAKEICSKCDKKRELKQMYKAVKKFMKEGVPTDIPYCKIGGAIDLEAKKIYCKLLSRRIKSKMCSTIDNGKPCINYKTVKVKVKIPEVM